MGVSKSKDSKMVEQALSAQYGQQGQQMYQQQQAGQQAFGGQSGPYGPQMNAQLNQQMQQQLQQQIPHQMQQQMSQQPIGQSGFSSFPPFPALPPAGMNNMQFPNLPSLPANAIFPSNTSSAFPVSFANHQQMKPLIPGYAPAPDRRAMLPPQQPQQQVEHIDQNDFVSARGFYVEQQVMPQMQGMPVKSRKPQQQH